jgi:DNA-binding NarL/FixJ family response regulator
VVRRAQIVLLAAKGKQIKQIADELGIMPRIVTLCGDVSSSRVWKG